jgi:hypothetical protein
MHKSKTIYCKYLHFWGPAPSNKENIHFIRAMTRVSPSDIISIEKTTKRIKWLKFLRLPIQGPKCRKISQKNPFFI